MTYTVGKDEIVNHTEQQDATRTCSRCSAGSQTGRTPSPTRSARLSSCRSVQEVQGRTNDLFRRHVGDY